MLYFAKQFTMASQYPKDSQMRMVYITLGFLTGFNQVVDRIGKPFNPLLGETYELVTPEIRCLTETVSHHPPIFAIMS